MASRLLELRVFETVQCLEEIFILLGWILWYALLTMIDSSLDPSLILSIVKVVLIIVVSIVLIEVIKRFFNRLVVSVAEERLKVSRGRLVHVNRLFQLIVYSIAVILILWTFDVDVTGLVAGLGVGALITGFALKEIIENWVSGLLLISGKTYEIGDVIDVGGLKGVVTDISLRTTKLKTYDRNEIIIPNSTLLKDKITNLTGGKREAVASITFSIDYVYSVEGAKKVIEKVLRGHPNVVVDEDREREIRFLIRVREWATDIESLFWINEPENEVFIKSKITELVKRGFEEEGILPPIPSIIRKEYMGSQNKSA